MDLLDKKKDFKPSILGALYKTLLLIGRKQVKSLVFIFVLCLVAGSFDLIGLGLILLYLRIVFNGIPNFLIDMSPAFEGLSAQELALYGGICLFILISCKNIFSIFSDRLLNKFTFKQSEKTILEAYNYVMNWPYMRFVGQELVNIASTIGSDIRRAYFQAVQPFVLLLRDVTLIMMILFMLLFINPIITLSLMGLAVIFFVFNILFLKRTIRSLAIRNEIALQQTKKWLSHSLRSFVDIRLSENNYFYKKYKKAVVEDTHNQFKAQCTNSIPPVQIEILLTISVIIIMLYLTYSGENITNLFPVFVIIGFAGLRVLAILNRIFNYLKMIAIAYPIVEKTLNLKLEISKFEQQQARNSDILPSKDFIFKKSIVLDNISFSYPQKEETRSISVLNNINLEIPKGAFIGLVGESGSGKSTLVNIILHLLEPKKGRVLVDGIEFMSQSDKKGFWSNVGYIPQNPVVLPQTIREYIAFGKNINEIDEDKVWDSLEKAHLRELIESYKNGLDTELQGEDASLSGGQRQRLLLARMFYHAPNILILDEATSALDNKTETIIAQSLLELKKQGHTIICIAHRLSTVKYADTIFVLEKGEIIAYGDFNNLRNDSAVFRELMQLNEATHI